MSMQNFVAIHPVVTEIFLCGLKWTELILQSLEPCVHHQSSCTWRWYRNNTVQYHYHKLPCQKFYREKPTSLWHICGDCKSEFCAELFCSIFIVPLLCANALTQGGQHGVGQTRRDAEVSSEEAAVCLSRRWAAAEDRTQTRRPAAAGSRSTAHCGETLTDSKLWLGYIDEGKSCTIRQAKHTSSHWHFYLCICVCISAYECVRIYTCNIGFCSFLWLTIMWIYCM